MGESAGRALVEVLDIGMDEEEEEIEDKFHGDHDYIKSF